MSISLTYTTIVLYLLILVGVGIVFSRLNKNTDDFFRGGCKGTWWLVGMSAFMASFSAWTFTGAAGVAFEAGWSILFIYAANVLGYLIAGMFLAPWFRQLRIVARPELDRLRWTETWTQLSTYINLLMPPFMSGLHLYGLSIFASAIFGYDIFVVIIVLGLVTTIYSAVGGVWGVMATDFLQGAILIPFTVLATVLCLVEIGGIGELFAGIEQMGLSDDFALLKPEGWSAQNEYTWIWAVALVLSNLKAFVNMNNAMRYNAVKDGKEARKAAYLGAALFFVGSFFWFVPPMVARLLYADEVMAAAISRPSESAYAIACLKVLPGPLIGLMVVAVFSATLSSMDTGMTRHAATIVRIVFPGIGSLFGLKMPTDDKKLVRMSRGVTCFLGLLITGMALYYANVGGKGIFQLMLDLMAFLTAICIPAILGLFVRRVPSWAPYVTLGIGLIPATLGIFSGAIFGEPWNFQTKFFMNFFIGSAAFLATMPFYRFESEAYKAKAAAFFERMKRPIDLAKEVGPTNDLTQLSILGKFTLVIGCYIAALALFPQSFSDRIETLALSMSVLAIGWLMFRLSVKRP